MSESDTNKLSSNQESSPVDKLGARIEVQWIDFFEIFSPT